MRKNQLKTICFIGSLFSIVSCKQLNQTDVEKLLTKNPVTIKVHNSIKEINSISANVKVFSKSNRNTKDFEQTGEYRMAIKEIDGRICTRIDQNDTNGQKTARTIISDSKSAVIYNPFTNTVQSKFNLPEKENTALDFLTASPITGRINLEQIKKESKRLNFDMTEDSETNGLLISIPAELVKTNTGESCISAKVCLDETSETINEVELVMLQEDGSTVTSSVRSVYEEKDGELIKIGTITVIETQNPNLLSGYDDNITIYNSTDDIPEISDAEFQQLSADEEIYEIPDVIIGNPADMSEIITQIELYDYIELNAVEDSQFKLLFE